MGRDCPLDFKVPELLDRSLHDLCPFPALIPFLNMGIARGVQSSSLLDQARDAYSNNLPCDAYGYAHVASTIASLGRWAIWAHYGGCGIAQASQQFPGCLSEARAATALGSVADLGERAYQALWDCCESQ